jgi:Rap guanine nucleotide exchange factor 1
LFDFQSWKEHDLSTCCKRRRFPLSFVCLRQSLTLLLFSSNELSDKLLKTLSQFVSNLIRHGELQLGKLLRRTALERFTRIRTNVEQGQQDIVLIRNSISSKRASLLDFHSIDISEQLTLLDSELFLRIQLSEILYMSIEKGEDYSPNLAAFTEHFNNISYW